MSNIIVSVKLWGIPIGKLAYAGEQREFATFEYEKELLDIDIQLSPLKVQNNIAIHTFDDISTRTFKGLPGFIADSLPDKFGNQLIDQYFADKGIADSDITSLDRLLYVGNRSMGALEYEPAKDNSTTGTTLELQDLSKLADMLISNKKEFAKQLNNAQKEQAIALLRIGSSAGGARAKALVAIDKKGKLYDGTIEQKVDCDYYLLKFDTGENSDRDAKDPKGMTRVEYIYSLLAKKCGIDIPKTSFIETNSGEDFHYLIERFDRIKDENGDYDKLHYVSWCGMAHAHRDEVGAFSYEQLLLVIRELNLKDDVTEELFRRAVFNIIGRNQDDHTKNFGFLMDREGSWSFSPAFDLTYSFDPKGKWTKTHQIKLNGKQDNFTKEDILNFGEKCNLSKKKAQNILENTIEVFKEFEPLANKYKVPEKLKMNIMHTQRLHIIKD
jgi:serine/threonine-protein kinase HipA